MVLTFLENVLNLGIFTHPPPQSKIFHKFYQKIWGWLGTLGYLYFVWFVIFSNEKALQFSKKYLSFDMALILLSLLFNDDNVILKLHQKNIANLMKGVFLQADSKLEVC